MTAVSAMVVLLSPDSLIAGVGVLCSSYTPGISTSIAGKAVWSGSTRTLWSMLPFQGNGMQLQSSKMILSSNCIEQHPHETTCILMESDIGCRVKAQCFNSLPLLNWRTYRCLASFLKDPGLWPVRYVKSLSWYKKVYSGPCNTNQKAPGSGVAQVPLARISQKAYSGQEMHLARGCRID